MAIPVDRDVKHQNKQISLSVNGGTLEILGLVPLININLYNNMPGLLLVFKSLSLYYYL